MTFNVSLFPSHAVSAGLKFSIFVRVFQTLFDIVSVKILLGLLSMHGCYQYSLKYFWLFFFIRCISQHGVFSKSPVFHDGYTLPCLFQPVSQVLGHLKYLVPTPFTLLIEKNCDISKPLLMYIYIYILLPVSHLLVTKISYEPFIRALQKCCIT